MIEDIIFFFFGGEQRLKYRWDKIVLLKTILAAVGFHPVPGGEHIVYVGVWEVPKYLASFGHANQDAIVVVFDRFKFLISPRIRRGQGALAYILDRIGSILALGNQSESPTRKDIVALHAELWSCVLVDS